MTDKGSLQTLFDFMELGCADEAFEALLRPLNVNRPENNLLTHDEIEKFEGIAAPMMKELGYGQAPEYLVNY